MQFQFSLSPLGTIGRATLITQSRISQFTWSLPHHLVAILLLLFHCFTLCRYGSNQWEQLRTQAKLTAHSSLSKRTIWGFEAQKSYNMGYFGLDVGEAPGLWDTAGPYLTWERKTRKQPPPHKKSLRITVLIYSLEDFRNLSNTHRLLEKFAFHAVRSYVRNVGKNNCLFFLVRG